VAGLYVAQRRPTTRGSVSLASADAAVAALVRDGWEDGSAAAAHDREVLVSALERLVLPLLDAADDDGLPRRLGHPPHEPDGTFGAALRSWRDRNGAVTLGAALAALPECRLAVSPFESCTNSEECYPTVPTMPRRNHSALLEAVEPILASSHHCQGTAAHTARVRRRRAACGRYVGVRQADRYSPDVGCDDHRHASGAARARRATGSGRGGARCHWARVGRRHVGLYHLGGVVRMHRAAPHRAAPRSHRAAS